MPETKVTLKDTKAKIMAAYEKTLADLNAAKSQQFNPAELKDREISREAVERVEELEIDWDLPTAFAQMRKGIDTNLRGIQDTLEREKRDLDTLRVAKEAITAELKELYDISAEAQSFAALVEAKKKYEEEHAEVLLSRVKDLEARITAHEEAMKSEREEWEEERQKRTQEWEYEFKRRSKQQEDELADTLAATRKKWLTETEIWEKTMSEREEAIAKQEEEISGLRMRVSSFPEQLEKTEAEAKKKAAQSYAIEVSHLKKSHEADSKILEHEVGALKETNRILSVKLEEAGNKLEAAYERIQGVASKALDAQGNINTTAEVQKAVAAATQGKR